jgi:hypothetical protein
MRPRPQFSTALEQELYEALEGMYHAATFQCAKGARNTSKLFRVNADAAFMAAIETSSAALRRAREQQ